MRASAPLRLDVPRRRATSRNGDPLSMATRLVWRARATRERSDLERTLTAARLGTEGRAGVIPVLEALEKDSVEQLVVTRRFMEREDDEAKKLIRLATQRDTRTVVVNGAAALELDLFAEGVASRLRA